MVRKDDYRMWFGGRKPNLTTLANWFDNKTLFALAKKSWAFFLTDMTC